MAAGCFADKLGDDLFAGRGADSDRLWPLAVGAAALLNIVAFDLFFVAPAGSFAVSDAEYLVTFTVMLAVGLLIGNLTAGVRYQASVARHGEQPVCYLYEIADGQRRSHTFASGW